jgi:hypothetical protein
MSRKPHEPTRGPLLSDIVVGKPPRPIDREKVKDLAVSIEAVGLMNPLIVDWGVNREAGGRVSGKCKLIAGFHRLEAIRLLGWQRVPAITRTSLIGDPDIDETPQQCGLRNQAMQLTENLARSELSDSERAAMTFQWREVLKQLGQAVGSGGPRERAGAPKPNTPTRGQLKKQQARASDNQSDTVSQNRSASQPIREREASANSPGRPREHATDTIAAATGKSKRTVQRAIQKAEGRTPKRNETEKPKASKPKPATLGALGQACIGAWNDTPPNHRRQLKAFAVPYAQLSEAERNELWRRIGDSQ